MTISTHIRQKGTAILAASMLAALGAPTALADPPQGHRADVAEPDLVERYVASGRSQADVIERWVDGRAGTGQPDLVERYVASHSTRFVGRDKPDSYQPQLRRASSSPIVSRLDDGFSRSDAGIGALAAFALTLVAGGTLFAARGRSRMAHS